MSFLIDTDICSAYLKHDPTVVSRVMLHFGGLEVSAITVGELMTWTMRLKAPPARRQGVYDLLRAAAVLDVTLPVAEKFGELRAALMDQGRRVDEMDLLIAATALVHNVPLVTHNVQDFCNIPGLTVVDWLKP
ncbi:MAG TPA: type II toxin-antitoxin system VapC family toxin [Pirellulales bacterium]|nr:type II toxin-antitoxin system VapC family toxin [Pirellulales bacterium]